MDTFHEVLAAARGLPEIDRRRLAAEVAADQSAPNRKTLRGFAIGPWLERALAHHSDAHAGAAHAAADKRRDDS